MQGFGGRSKRGNVSDFSRFPGYAKLKAGAHQGKDVESASVYVTPECQCAVRYDPAKREALLELDLFAAALDQTGLRSAFADTFVTAASPGIVSTTLLRSATHPVYATDRDYVLALANELRGEYELIVARGHVLQLDAPDLALERQVMFAGQPLDAFLERVALHVEAINLALANIPRERVRLHMCWGNWDGPHIDDVDLEPLLPLLYGAKVGALSIACAMPRHQHEYKLFGRHPLPPGLLLIPGVIDVTTNVLEHPEVVADRIERICEVVGDPRRVLAGTDCGFGTFAGYALVAPDVVWEKLRVLRQGADLATSRLFS
jgi:5-methyltetrahydropteroyltriglutamate--homocysteine methyltransferase